MPNVSRCSSRSIGTLRRHRRRKPVVPSVIVFHRDLLAGHGELEQLEFNAEFDSGGGGAEPWPPAVEEATPAGDHQQACGTPVLQAAPELEQCPPCEVMADDSMTNEESEHQPGAILSQEPLESSISEASGVSATASLKAVGFAPQAVHAALQAVRADGRGSICMQVAGIEALEHLAVGEASNAAEMLAAGGIQSIAAASQQHRGSERLQEAVCKATLAVALLGGGAREAVVDAGGLQSTLLAMTMQRESAAVQVAGCRVLKELAANSVPIQNCMAECGAMEAVLAAMRAHPSSAAVQEVACGVLRNVSLGNAAQQDAIVAQGGIDAVLCALRLHAEEAMVQWAGCWALFCIAVRNAQTQAQARASGAAHQVLQAMLAYRCMPKVQEAGIWALKELSSRGEPPAELNSRAQAVARALEDHPFDAQILRAGRAAMTVLSITTEKTLQQPQRLSAAGRRHRAPVCGLPTIQE